MMLTNWDLPPELKEEIISILPLQDICRFHAFPLKRITLNGLFLKIMTDNFFLQ